VPACTVELRSGENPGFLSHRRGAFLRLEYRYFILRDEVRNPELGEQGA